MTAVWLPVTRCVTGGTEVFSRNPESAAVNLTTWGQDSYTRMDKYVLVKPLLQGSRITRRTP
jgi:hypothetical protein